jgi:integrase
MKRYDESNMKLLDYVERVLVPSREAAGSIAPATVWSWRYAVRRLYEAEGREVKCREVDEAMLARMVDSMRRRGYKLRQKKNVTDYIRSIIRQWNPTAIQLARDADPLLSTVYARQYERIKIRSRRPNTKRLYRITLAKFDEFLGRDARLSDLNDDTVSAFASWRLENGASKRTVNRDLCNILAIWRWLIGRHRRIHSAPNVEMEIVPTRTPKALLPVELGRVVAAIDAETLSIGRVSAPVFWKALFLLFWDTAERIGGVIRLTWDRVDLDGGFVRFAGEDRKGGIEDNTLPIAPDTVAALQSLKLASDGRSPLVFYWPYHPTYIYRRLARIMQRAGLPDDRMHKFHVFRKSVASHYEAAGGNATALLKHSARKVTLAYIDPRVCRTPSAVDLLFRPTDTATA